MKILAKTTQPTTASPEAIFTLWADVNQWASYDQSIKWAKLEESFAVGSSYTLKPQGGPTVKATIIAIEPNQRFDCATHLPGAKLRFDHIISRQDNHTIVSVVISLSGPMSWLWARILGKTQQAELEKSTLNLIAKAEK